MPTQGFARVAFEYTDGVLLQQRADTGVGDARKIKRVVRAVVSDYQGTSRSTHPEPAVQEHGAPLVGVTARCESTVRTSNHNT